MAITASGLYLPTWRDELDATDIGLDLSLATHKLALVADAYTPDFDAHDTFADLTNEVSDGVWAAGGRPLSTAAAGDTSTAPTLTISPAGTLMYDMTDVAVAGTTLTNAMAAVLYADALTTPVADALIMLIDFVTAFSTNNGTFGIQWAATGCATLDLTPP
jgi:hypothetical protein